MEEEERSSYINTVSSQIDAEFQDLIPTDDESPSCSTAPPRSRTIRKRSRKYHSEDPIESESESEDEGQDWEWVEETEYIILDFGGVNLDARDMEKLTSNGCHFAGLDTPTPYFKAGLLTFKGFFDENAITEDMLFDMKEREAREEQEEEIDESEDENADALDLLGIVTKRIIFESVDLVSFESDNQMLTPLPIGDKAPALLANTKFSKEKREPKMTIWKAAYDAVGLRRPPRKSDPNKDRGKGRAGVSKVASRNQAEASSSTMEIDKDQTPAPAGEDNDTIME
ncbi:hypothetical protein BGZ65_000711 [Modicella reniformis]|uniref:Transcription factor TFIIIC triple barrel domain-containing protein n=1 Tax=Modicella reniformis TaxID=1440133 RepID=A0A9P6M395_9FUNG|nr:hypothetical protein BGZ65_000711 [Modicella reniformis]